MRKILLGEYASRCYKIMQKVRRSQPPQNTTCHGSHHGYREYVAMYILCLPVSTRGNKYVVGIGSYFTKWTEAYPLSDQLAETVARVFVDEFVCRYGTSDTMHSDQGRQFEAQLFQEMCQLLDVHKTRTSLLRATAC